MRDPSVTRRRSRLGLFAVAALAATLALAACQNEVEDAVPDLAIAVSQGGDVIGEGDVTLAAVLDRGKPVVLNFWAALCGPCRLEMPEFQRVYDERAHEVTLLGVDIGPQWQLGTREQGEAFLAEIGITYPAGTTSDSDVNAKFGILGMPTTVFIRADGQVLRTWTGALNEAKMNEIIDELVTG